MNNAAKASVVLIAGLLIALCAGVAQAQLTVTVTVSGTQTTSPGATVDAGEFSVANTPLTIDETVTAVELSISNPSLFSSMTLTATGSDSVVQTISVPLQTSSTITFAKPVAVSLDEPAATFSLSARIAGGATPTATTDNGGVAFASIIWPFHNTAPGRILMVLGLFAIGMLWLDGRLKRRHLVALAIAMALAATEVGCGNCSGSVFGCGGSNVGIGSSDQQVTAINATPSGLTITGVPLDLGTITSQ